MKLYVASSWRCAHQPDTVSFLRKVGHVAYDFRNPREGGHGFNWSDIDPKWNDWSTEEFVRGLDHPLAVAGFDCDFSAMAWAEGAVLVLPCGRSAHLEAGWFVGRGRPVWILALEPCEPELMYRMVTGIYDSLPALSAAIAAHVESRNLRTLRRQFADERELRLAVGDAPHEDGA